MNIIGLVIKKSKILKIRFLLLCFTIKRNSFLLFSFIFGFVSAFLIGLIGFLSYYNNIIISDFFFSVAGMLGSVLSIVVAVHTFYVSSFLNYNSLVFLFDVSRDKKNYAILGFLSFVTLYFFVIGLIWNSLGFFNYDFLLISWCLFLMSFSIWLVIYYFHSITIKLSPRGMMDDIELFFKNTINSLKRLDNLKKTLLEDSDINSINNPVSPVSIDIMDAGWYKLTSLCDNYYKLLDIREYQLSNDLLIRIERCFKYFIDNYGPINSSVDLLNLVPTTLIDGKINMLFERIEGMIVSNIVNKNVEGITLTMRLYINLIILSSDVKHEEVKGFTDGNIIFNNLLVRYGIFFDNVLKYDNEEFLFQWKEGFKEIFHKIISLNNKSFEMSYRIDSLLKKVNILNSWAIIKQKVDLFSLYELYSMISLNYLYNDYIFSVFGSADILQNSINIFLNIEKNKNGYFESLNKSLLLSSDIIVYNMNNDNPNLGYYYNFLEFNKNVIQIVSQKNELSFSYSVFDFIKIIGTILFRLDKENLEINYLNKCFFALLSIIELVVTSDKILKHSDLGLAFVYDQLCWIGIYAKKIGDDGLFGRCFDIFSDSVDKLLVKGLNLHIGLMEYFCFRIFIDNEENYESYFKIWFKFFEIEKNKFGKEKSLFKKTMQRIILEIPECGLRDNFFDPKLSLLLLNDFDISDDKKLNISSLLLKYCSDLL